MFSLSLSLAVSAGIGGATCIELPTHILRVLYEQASPEVHSFLPRQMNMNV